MSQVHSKFKVFVCTPVDSKLDPDTVAEATKFFADRKQTLAPKSLGIEYLEQTNQLVMSLGYVEENLPTPHPTVKIDCVSLGRLIVSEAVVEAAMEDAASKVKNVICHEFYVDDGEFFMVLLSLDQ